jgi:hypothetical protein
MLRITSTSSDDATCLVLEGRLAGEWVEELARMVTWAKSLSRSGRVGLELTGLTFVAAEGYKFLECMAAEGIELHAEGVMNRFLVEEILRQRGSRP